MVCGSLWEGEIGSRGSRVRLFKARAGTVLASIVRHRRRTVGKDMALENGKGHQDENEGSSPDVRAKGQWWSRRTRTERHLSLLATVFLFVAVGLAIALAATVYNVRQFDPNIEQAAPTAFLPLVSSSALTQADPNDNDAERGENICKTKGCVLAAAELLENIDDSVHPCDDFYKFACGGFEKRLIIPDDQSAVTTFSLISDKVVEQLRSLVDVPVKENVVEPKPFQLVKDLYQSCVNKSQLEILGLAPLKKILEELGGWPAVAGDNWDPEDKWTWFEGIYRNRKMGYSVDYFIDFSVTSDLKNSSYRVIDLDQASLGMPGREYLIKGVADKDVKAYLNYQIGLATLLGADKARAEKELLESLNFEIQLANISLPREERRNASKLYNPMTIAELSKLVPGIPWLEYINTILAPHHVLTADERVIVDVPEYFKKLSNILAATPKRTMANYLMWRVAGASVSYLNEAARALQLTYSAVLTGTTERKPRWEECMETVSSSLGSAVGALYVRSYFKEDAKGAAVEMVEDIRAVFHDILDELDWMDDATRQRARKKAESVTSHIAYPDELLDDKKLTELYQDLVISKDQYLRNALNMTLFGTDFAFKRLRLPVNKTEWITHGRPAVVNAYYSPLENSIQFPAGILQGAFFGKERPAYLNYGAIGWVIGHELTHGFDDQGRQFDPDGNLIDWWEASTKTAYLQRAQCIISQYGNYSFPELNLNVNGINTQGENIADNGGIKEAYKAYKRWAQRHSGLKSQGWTEFEGRLPGLQKYSPRQMFWISAANVWCSKYRPESLKLRVLTGQHSPAQFRVRGPFANMNEFANDFECPAGSPMNPVSKCAVW